MRLLKRANELDMELYNYVQDNLWTREAMAESSDIRKPKFFTNPKRSFRYYTGKAYRVSVYKPALFLYRNLHGADVDSK